MSDVIENSDGTFTNTRTGETFSAERAHQSVGESIRGIEKAKSKTTGNYYMREELDDTTASDPLKDYEDAMKPIRDLERMQRTLSAGILGSHGRSA
jgi:hypothetical protein